MAEIVCVSRLLEERQKWRKQHPKGFVARPQKKPDGTLNIMTWDCLIPGPKGTAWEGGLFPVVMTFTDEYPSAPPKCRFQPPIFHPNVFSDGLIYLSLLNEYAGWSPTFSFKDILVGLKFLLAEPNAEDPANLEAANLYHESRRQFDEKVHELVRSMVQGT